MFANLSLKEFTWKREPILYIALAVAVLNVIAQAVAGDVTLAVAAESVALLIVGFFARGQVSPAG